MCLSSVDDFESTNQSNLLACLHVSANISFINPFLFLNKSLKVFHLAYSKIMSDEKQLFDSKQLSSIRNHLEKHGLQNSAVILSACESTIFNGGDIFHNEPIRLQYKNIDRPKCLDDFNHPLESVAFSDISRAINSSSGQLNDMTPQPKSFAELLKPQFLFDNKQILVGYSRKRHSDLQEYPNHSSVSNIAKLYPELAEKLDLTKQMTTECSISKIKESKSPKMSPLPCNSNQNCSQYLSESINESNSTAINHKMLKPHDSKCVPLSYQWCLSQNRKEMKSKKMLPSIQQTKIIKKPERVKKLNVGISLSANSKPKPNQNVKRNGHSLPNVLSCTTSLSSGCKYSHVPFKACDSHFDACTPSLKDPVDRDRHFQSSEVGDYWSLYKKRILLDQDICRYDPVNVDENVEEGLLTGQLHWFCPSSDEDSADEELSNENLLQQIRTIKLSLYKDRLRRHSLQLTRSYNVDRYLMDHCRNMTQSLIRALRSSSTAACAALRRSCRDTGPYSTKLWKRQRMARKCLHNSDTETHCGEAALPFTNHCSKHILYNIDQLLFDYCTAKYEDNKQCCVPVFDPKHDFPLCINHAITADLVTKSIQYDKKRFRKKTRPSALTKPPKKGKKKKNQHSKLKMNSDHLNDKLPENSGSQNPIDSELQDFKIPDEDWDKFFQAIHIGKNGTIELTGTDLERMLISNREEDLSKHLSFDQSLSSAELTSNIRDNDMLYSHSNSIMQSETSVLESNILDTNSLSVQSQEFGCLPHNSLQNFPAYSSSVVGSHMVPVIQHTSLHTEHSSSDCSHNMDLANLTVEQMNIIASMVSQSGNSLPIFATSDSLTSLSDSLSTNNYTSFNKTHTIDLCKIENPAEHKAYLQYSDSESNLDADRSANFPISYVPVHAMASTLTNCHDARNMTQVSFTEDQRSLSESSSKLVIK